ncbi:MAG: hypothetical protein J0H09_20070 [Burkholderiales bacterium]|nr:hypothetical protein [Burkholderiales bacterium]
MENPDRFKVIGFVIRRGYVLPWLAALIVLAIGFALSYRNGDLWCAVLAVPAAAIGWGLVRLAVELVDLVAETLLPR